jgi:hypothetical protein
VIAALGSKKNDANFILKYFLIKTEMNKEFAIVLTVGTIIGILLNYGYILYFNLSAAQSGPLPIFLPIILVFTKFLGNNFILRHPRVDNGTIDRWHFVYC